MYSSNLYKASYDHLKTLHKINSSSMKSFSILFVWFSFDLVCPKQRKTKMAEMNLERRGFSLCRTCIVQGAEQRDSSFWFDKSDSST